MELRSSFGHLVRQYRRSFGLTQEELARRVGCAAITVRKIESDDLRPSRQVAARLATVLAIPQEQRMAFIELGRLVRLDRQLPPPSSTTPPPVLLDPSSDLIGRRVRGYTITERIGSGSFGVVCTAEQQAVRRTVALKLLLPRFADDPDFIRYFEVEAQVVARLEHPHIVPLYDYWREPGLAVLAMRLMRGGSLWQRLHDGPLPHAVARQVMTQIGTALDAAHRAGIIHRDIKPANILLDEQGYAYLADFGIAQWFDEHRETTYGATSDDAATPQVDIAGFGRLLVALLTGTTPASGAAMAGDDPAVAALASIPAELAAIVRRAVTADPAQQYGSVLDVVADVQSVLPAEATVSDQALTMTTVRRVPADDGDGARNPYKGLRAFQEADAADFFGRELLIQHLLARVGEAGELARFLAVIGPSGSGKSSVVRAGLVPALRRGGLPGSEYWFVTDMLPGTDPFTELAAALERVAVRPVAQLSVLLRSDHLGLVRAVQACLPADHGAELLLVIDQFEELFTLVPDASERQQFLASLVAAVLEPESPLRLVITLRADFVDQPLLDMDFGELLRQRNELVAPLTPDELERAIVGPAHRAGLAAEQGLIPTMVQAVGTQPGALPLLAFALSELWTQRRGSLLTREAYQAIGGVAGALGRRAEDLFAALDADGQAAVRHVFLRLVTPGEGTEDTRRRVPVAELALLPPRAHETVVTPGEEADRGGDATDRSHAITGSEHIAVAAEQTECETTGECYPGAIGTHPTPSPVDLVLESYGAARLLTFDRDPHTRAPTVEVAHEALVREWSRLRGWLATGRDSLRVQRRLAADAQEWQRAGQDPSFLARGARLAQFAALDTHEHDTDVALNAAERTYLTASLVDQQRLTAVEQERRARELGALRALATEQQQRAEVQQQRAEEQERYADAERVASTRLRRRAWALLLALLFALGAAASAGLFAQRSGALAEQNARVAATAQTAAQERASAEEVAQDARAVAQNQATEARIRAWIAEAKASVDIDPERSILLGLTAVGATASGAEHLGVEAEAVLRRAVAADHLEGILPLPDGVKLAAVSPDGRLLAVTTATTDTWQLVLVDAATTALKWQIDRAPDGVPPADELFERNLAYTQPSWSPDGTQIAATVLQGATGHTAVLDAASGTQRVIIPSHNARFNADGTELIGLVNPPDPTVVDVAWSIGYWDARTGTLLRATPLQIRRAPGDVDSWQAAVFSPDLRNIALYSFRSYVFDVATGQQRASFGTAENQVVTVAFSPDGTHMAYAGTEGTLTVVENEHGAVLFSRTVTDTPIVWLEFSPNGRRLAIGDFNDQLLVWDIATRMPYVHLPEHPSVIDSTVWLTDHRLLSMSQGRVRAWDVGPDREEAPFVDALGDFGFRLNADRTRLLSFGGAAVTIFDANSLETLQTISVPGELRGGALTSDNQQLVTGESDGTVRIWNVASGAQVGGTSHRGLFPVLALHPNGRLVIGGEYYEEFVWDLVTGRELMSFENGPLAFSPDGQLLAAQADMDGTIVLADAMTGTVHTTLQGQKHEKGRVQIEFSLDGGQILASNVDETITLWDIAAERELLTYAKHQASVTSVAFSPDGSRVASISTDGAVHFWNSTTGATEWTAQIKPGLGSVGFPSDGTRLLAGTKASGLTALVLQRDDVVALARARLSRGWTPQECQQYLQQNSCPAIP